MSNLLIFIIFISTFYQLKLVDVQLESCELSFIWGTMRTAAREAASQIALRACSKAAVGESQCIRFWGVQYHEALNLQKVFCQS